MTTTDYDSRGGKAPITTNHFWATVVTIVLLIAGSFAIALLRASNAVDVAQHAAEKAQVAADDAKRAASLATVAAARAAAIAECVNSVLAERAVLAQADHDNENAKIVGQKAAVNDQEAGLAELVAARGDQAQALAGFDLYVQGIAKFKKALDDWTARDNVITKQKQLHPLGRC